MFPVGPSIQNIYSLPYLQEICHEGDHTGSIYEPCQNSRGIPLLFVLLFNKQTKEKQLFNFLEEPYVYMVLF